MTARREDAKPEFLGAFAFLRRFTLFCSLVFVITLPVHAQSAALEFGVTVRGRLDDAAPRIVYTFDGLRGDVISLSLQVTGGDLEPMLILMNGVGTVIDLPDDAPGRDVRFGSLRVPETAEYFVILSRFGDRLGTTAGDYSLSLTRVGVSSEGGSVLRYGDSVYNSVDNRTPQVFYSFQAARGDIISIQMQQATGNLDPTLQLINSRSEVVAENDDQDASNDAAIVGYTIREDGVYVILASRYGGVAGQSQGAFILTLSAGEESGLGGSVEFAVTILPGEPVRGRITDLRDVQFYRFDGRQGDVVTIRMSRMGGDIDPLIALADVTGRELVEDDDTGGGQNSLIQDFRLPADGTYLILATRYQRAEGTTTGDYELMLEVN